MPVSELDVTNALFWLCGANPTDQWGQDLAEELNLRKTRDARHLREVIISSARFRMLLDTHPTQPPRRALRPERPRLVFLHMPKCGGTTLHAILTRQFAPESICPERFNGLGEYRQAELAEYTLFSGHFDLESCGALVGSNVKIVTMLRDPRERLISLYHFLSVHNPGTEPETAGMVTLARTLNIEDFFQHPSIRRHASVYNAMTSVLIEPQIAKRWEAIEAQRSNDDLVVVDPERAGRLALTALKSLAGFGLLEQFNDSLELLSDLLSLRLEPIPALQVTDELKAMPHLHYADRPAVTPTLLGLLDELTQADRQLYEEAQGIFAQRFSDLKNRVPLRPERSFDRPEPVPLDRFQPYQGRGDRYSIVASGDPGVLAAGPYMPLKHGHYRLLCHFAGPADEGQPFTLHIWFNKGRAVCKTIRWHGPTPCRVDFSLAFDVSDIEFVVVVEPDSGFELLAMELAPARDIADRAA